MACLFLLPQLSLHAGQQDKAQALKFLSLDQFALRAPAAKGKHFSLRIFFYKIPCFSHYFPFPIAVPP